MNDDWAGVEPPAAGVPKDATPLPMLAEDREWLIDNDWREVPDGWEKRCLR